MPETGNTGRRKPPNDRNQPNNYGKWPPGFLETTGAGVCGPISKSGLRNQVARPRRSLPIGARKGSARPNKPRSKRNPGGERINCLIRWLCRRCSQGSEVPYSKRRSKRLSGCSDADDRRYPRGGTPADVLGPGASNTNRRLPRPSVLPENLPLREKPFSLPGDCRRGHKRRGPFPWNAGAHLPGSGRTSLARSDPTFFRRNRNPPCLDRRHGLVNKNGDQFF